MVPAIRIRMIEAKSFLKMAEIDEDCTPAAADELSRSAVIVSEDPTRVAWLTALAVCHGLVPRDVRDWLVDPEPPAETVIFCDADGVTPARAERLQPLLERHQGVFYRIGTGESHAHACRGARGALPLSLAFSAAELGLKQL
jgi:hypothetical protein